MDSFDTMAATWDLDPQKVERARRVADAILRQAGPLAGKRALEFGCGTGLLGFALQPHLAHMTLADTSPGMLAVLREKIASRGLDNLAPLHLDPAAWSDLQGAFDLVVTLMTLHHVPDTDAILRRFHGLLGPEGLLAISDLDKEDGSFHGPDADVHRGFDRDDLADRLARSGFGNIRFSTPFVIEKESGAGTTRFPLFLVLANRLP